MMALDFNNQDAMPGNYQELISLKNSTSNPLWVKNVLTAQAPELHKMKQKFIRTGAAATGQDINTTDAATFYWGWTQMTPTLNNAGYMWVTYSVDLFTPQYNVAASTESVTGAVHSVTGVNLLNIFGTTPVLTGGLIMTALANTLTIDRNGLFLFTWKITGVGLVPDSFPTITTLNSVGAFGVSIKINAAATIAVMFGVFRNRPENPYVFDFTGTAGAITESELHVSPHSFTLA